MNLEPQEPKLPKLNLADNFKKAFELLGKRPGIFVLCALMFVLPASLMVNIQSVTMPQDLTGFELEELIRVILPVLLWSIIAFLFEMIGFMVISVYVMRSSFSTENENFGTISDQDFTSYLTIAFKAVPRGVLTQMVLFLTLGLLVFFFITLMSISTLMAFLGLIPAIVAFFIFLMYRYGSIIMSVRVRAMSYQLAIGSQAVLRESFWKSFGRFMLIFAITMLPSFGIRYLASALLDAIDNKVVLVAVATAVDTIFSVFEMYLVTFMSVRIHHALKYALSD